LTNDTFHTHVTGPAAAGFAYFLNVPLLEVPQCVAKEKIAPQVFIVDCGMFVVATSVDLEHMLIPDEITWGGIGAGALVSPSSALQPSTSFS
jgi:hypothetical protein